MKILIIDDKIGSGIDRAVDEIAKRNEHLDIKVLPFHPKRYLKEDLKIADRLIEWADLVDVQYWKSGMVLMDNIPSLKNKLTILTHHNPYNLHESDWKDFIR